jgi:hypothetical protein
MKEHIAALKHYKENVDDLFEKSGHWLVASHLRAGAKTNIWHSIDIYNTFRMNFDSIDDSSPFFDPEQNPDFVVGCCVGALECLVPFLDKLIDAGDASSVSRLVRAETTSVIEKVKES